MLIQMKHPSTIQDPVTIMAVMNTCKDGSILVWESLHSLFLIIMAAHGQDRWTGLNGLSLTKLVWSIHPHNLYTHLSVYAVLGRQHFDLSMVVSVS